MIRILARNFPITEILAHILIVTLVLVSYGFLLQAAFILPLPSVYNNKLGDVFQKFVSPDPVFPGDNSRWCDTSDGMIGFVSMAERGRQCQLTFEDFRRFCSLFGLKFTEAESRILFDTLDITGNGMVNWGEMSSDFFNSNLPVFIYYVSRWKSRRYEKTGGIGNGLERVEGFNYEPFRWDNQTVVAGPQGTWGPNGIYTG